MREIVEEPSFADSCEQYGGLEWFDGIRLMLDWALATFPEEIPLAVGNLRLLRTDEFPGIPDCRILVEILNENQVALVYIERTDETPFE